MNTKSKLKTKDKIVLAAIKLFNEVGIQGITSRHIAAEMGISHGNLDYHYKTKEDLLLAIYEKMRQEISQSYFGKNQKGSSLQHFHQLLVDLEEFQFRYRFFNLDVLEITRSYPKVRQIILETFDQRKSQTQDLFDQFVSEGYAEFPNTETLRRILHLVRMVVTFWLSQCEILSSYHYTQKGEMVNSIWFLLQPYLTPAGLEEYAKILDNKALQPDLSLPQS